MAFHDGAEAHLDRLLTDAWVVHSLGTLVLGKLRTEHILEAFIIGELIFDVSGQKEFVDVARLFTVFEE